MLQPKLKPIEETETEQIFEYNEVRIPIRKSDGFFNLTAICQAKGKRYLKYEETQRGKNFIIALAGEEGLHPSQLVEVIKGGHPTLQGTWGHELLAYDVASWADPAFGVWISKVIRCVTRSEQFNVDVLSGTSVDVLNPDSTSQTSTPPALEDFAHPVEVNVEYESEEDSDFDFGAEPRRLEPIFYEGEGNVKALNDLTNVLKSLYDCQEKEKQLFSNMTSDDRKNLGEIRTNLTDLTRRQVTQLREQIAPNTNDIELDQVILSDSKVSLPRYNSSSPYDLVPIHQRVQELFLTGQIPRTLLYDELLFVGKRVSAAFQKKYGRYPSRTRFHYENQKVGNVNVYLRSDLPELVDPQIKHVFETHPSERYSSEVENRTKSNVESVETI